MDTITVKEVCQDYIEFNIAKKYKYDKDRKLQGLLDILANHGLKVKITNPESQDLKAIKRHYCHIVKQCNSKARNQSIKAFKNSDEVFYSKEKYPDLCFEDHEQRYV